MQRLTRQILFTLLIWALALPLWAGSLNARVDRDHIQETETLRLVLELRDYDGPIDPDLSGVEALFEVLGTSQSSRVSIVNGRMDSAKELIITLAPKQTGTLVIPAITLGTLQSDPLTIKVTKAEDLKDGQGQALLFMEAEVDTDNPYVQQQVILTLRLYHAINLLEGVLPEPELPGVEVMKLGEDVQYQATLNGRPYGVIERRYGLIPQTSGQIEIPTILFRGQAQDSRSRFDSLLGSPFNRGQTVQARSPALTLDVQARPSQLIGPWLPASQLTIEESWSPSPPVFRVGEPVTRTLTIQATGLTAAQLPELPQPTVDAVKVYPDQPHLETTASVQGLQANRMEKYAVVPTQPGEITLPAINLVWWNTQSRQLQTTTLPAKKISVLPARLDNLTVQPQPAPTQALAPLNQGGTEDTLTAAPVTLNQSPAPVMWPWYLAVSLLSLGWFFTLYLWWRQTPPNGKIRHPASHEKPVKWLRAVKQACQANNPQQTKQALLAWAKAQWPENPPRNLGEIAEKIQDKTLQAALQQLDGALYSTQGETWDGSRLSTAIRHAAFPAAGDGKKQADSGLARLNP